MKIIYIYNMNKMRKVGSQSAAKKNAKDLEEEEELDFDKGIEESLDDEKVNSADASGNLNGILIDDKINVEENIEINDTVSIPVANMLDIKDTKYNHPILSFDINEEIILNPPKLEDMDLISETESKNNDDTLSVGIYIYFFKMIKFRPRKIFYLCKKCRLQCYP
jgi:hypothetical protein